MKTHFIILSFFTLLISHSTMAQFWHSNKGVQASGTVVETTTPLKTFEALKIDDAFNVELVAADKESISITTDEAFLPYIVAEVDQHSLHIYTNKRLNRKGDIPLDVVIYYKAIKEISINDASKLLSHNSWQGDRLLLKAKDASDIELVVECQYLKAYLSDASKAHLSGQCQTADLHISDASRLDALHMACETLDAKASDAAQAKLCGNSQINIDAHDISKIIYCGDAKHTKIKCSDLSKVRKR